MPEDLAGIKSCFSAGVGDNASFEFELASRFGIHCYLADFSVDSPPLKSDKFVFVKKYISERDSPDSIKFESWLKTAGVLEPDRLNPNSILAMDIEGSELEILLSAPPDSFTGFKYIVLELHNLERILHEPFLQLYSLAVQKLLSNFSVCHLHPNNVIDPVVRYGITLPCALEITLVNNTCLPNYSKLPYVYSYHHPLDVPKINAKPEVRLSNHWLRK